MTSLPSPPTPAEVERYTNAVMAGHRGDLEAARIGLTDDAPLVRQAALSALRRLGACTTDDLELGLRDRSPRVRSRAAELSAQVAGADPTPALVDPDPTVVEVACFACGEMSWTDGTPAPIDTLSTIATTHDDPLCRESAAAALGAIGDPAGLPAVLQACTDRVTVRRRAILALAAFDDPLADAALTVALDDKDWQVRQAAEDLLEVGRVLDHPEDPHAYAD